MSPDTSTSFGITVTTTSSSILALFSELGSYKVSYRYTSSNYQYGHKSAIQLGELGSIYINDHSSSGSFTGSISTLQQIFSHLDYGNNNGAADLAIIISNVQ